MAGIYNKSLLGCFLMLVLVSGMNPQAHAPGTLKDEAPASPQSSALTQSQNVQDQNKQQKPALVYESATVLKSITRLVVVDVVATGKDGAVTDLQRDDFTVLEDGKEQKVRVFSFQQPRVNTSGGAPIVPPRLPENVYSNVARYNTSSALNVVLLDALNTNLPNQAYVRDQMIRYLEKMPEGQPVAVYTLGTKLTLLQDFTNDPAVLKAVVKELKGKVSPLQDNPAGGPEPELLPAGLADSGMMPAGMLDAMQRFEQERVSFQTDLRITYTVNALTSIARSLSGYPGRKNLIWVSEAFPLSVDPNMELTGDIFAGTRNYGAQIAKTADALIDAQIAIYPIDARGLAAPSVFSAANSGRDKFGRSLGRGGRFGSAISSESAQLQNVHGAMQEMADRTGGRAFYNTNGIDGAIRKSIEDGSTYYTLAYYPENKNWNGKFRKIQVKVNQHGIKLRYRLGYYAVDPRMFVDQNQKQQMAAFELALSPDSPISTALPFNALVIPPAEKSPNTVRVNFGVDPHAISFEKQADGLEHAKVECTVQVFSVKGKPMGGKLTTVNAALKQETFDKVMQDTFPCQQAVDLQPGSYFLRLGVRDDRTGLIGTTNAKVSIAALGTPMGRR
ncbi:MAG: VWA domain-containing protein [Acidobacteriia bacterium]|nr:VWA domain-containing protein [Terriglobia bacterium]